MKTKQEIDADISHCVGTYGKYTESLDLMASAEKHLTANEFETYGQHMIDFIDADTALVDDDLRARAIMSSPEVRARAFCLTKGL